MASKPVIAVAVEQTNGYARELLRGVADFATSHVDIDFRLVDPDEFTRRLPRTCDGYICRVASDVLADRLARTGKPVVDLLYNRSYPIFTVVRPDIPILARLAMDHFRVRRFTHLAYCGYDGLTFSDLRRSAFQEAVCTAEADMLDVAVYTAPRRIRHAFGIDLQMISRVNAAPDTAHLAAWLQTLPRPIGILCCDDLRARQLLDVCHACGVSVPHDVAILGIDDDPVFCLFSTPRLSSVNPNAFGIGHAAAAAVCERLAGSAGPDIRFVPPIGITVRESTETYPVDPPWLSDALVFIHRHATQGISAADVFRHVGYSHTLVHRVFRAVLGHGVQQEIAAVRLDEARRLLAHGGHSITDVARRCGFASNAYFSHAFAARFGHSPSHGRK